jgi:cellulose biosynthesis protein BcsQ
MKNLVYVGGSKGGTGKSLFCMALADYFRKTFSGDKIMIIDTDSSNPDVGRLYRGIEGVSSNGLFLDDEEKGWVTMIDTISDTSAKHIIVNSMAAANLGVQAQGPLLDQNILDGRLKVKFDVFWV